MKNILKGLSGYKALIYLFVSVITLSLALVSCGGGGYGGGGGGMSYSAPGAFSLSAPSNNMMAVGATPTLTWTASPYATSYTVQVSADAFATTVVNVSVGTTSFPVSTPLAPGTYVWRVTATNLYGKMTAGPFTFTT
jgi:hypothetical protein